MVEINKYIPENNSDIKKSNFENKEIVENIEYTLLDLVEKKSDELVDLVIDGRIFKNVQFLADGVTNITSKEELSNLCKNKNSLLTAGEKLLAFNYNGRIILYNSENKMGKTLFLNKGGKLTNNQEEGINTILLVGLLPSKVDGFKFENNVDTDKQNNINELLNESRYKLKDIM